MGASRSQMHWLDGEVFFQFTKQAPVGTFSSTHDAINQLFWCAIRNPFCLHGSPHAHAMPVGLDIGNKINEYRLPGRGIIYITLRDVLCLSFSRAADLHRLYTTTFHRLGAKRSWHALFIIGLKCTHWYTLSLCKVVFTYIKNIIMCILIWDQRDAESEALRGVNKYLGICRFAD